MRSKNMIWMRSLALCATMALATASEAASTGFDAFFGEFEGQAVSESGGEIRKRDLRVKISPHKKGFTVNWISVTKRSDGKLKRKEYSIDFHPTRRAQ